MSILSPALLCCIVVISFVIASYTTTACAVAREMMMTVIQTLHFKSKQENEQASKQTSNGFVDSSNEMFRECYFFIRKIVEKGVSEK